jgi:hypothetical protein
MTREPIEPPPRKSEKSVALPTRTIALAQPILAAAAWLPSPLRVKASG